MCFGTVPFNNIPCRLQIIGIPENENLAAKPRQVYGIRVNSHGEVQRLRERFLKLEADS
jgi:hypothetical protein